MFQFDPFYWEYAERGCFSLRNSIIAQKNGNVNKEQIYFYNFYKFVKNAEQEIEKVKERDWQIGVFLV